MRIVFIITGLSTGGAEMMLLKVLERLDKRFEPLVISLTTMGEIGPRIRQLGISVEALSINPRLPSPFDFLKLTRRLRVLKPDAVHTWMYHADLLGGLAARRAGINAIAWGIRNSFKDRNKLKFATRLVVSACARLSGSLPDRILVCSDMARRTHIEAGYAANRMVVIPNGFDLDSFRPNVVARDELRAELGLKADATLVGMMGRFDPQKNHAGFIKAASILHQSLTDVHFVLAGKGIDLTNTKLASAIDVAGIGQVTHLLGRRQDMPRLMASLDILALSSSAESFPNVLGEAMASGVPCVATDVGDSALIVGDTGRIVQAGNMEELAKAMQSLLELPEDERQLLGIQARTRIEDHFEIGQIVKRYEHFYDELDTIGKTKQ